MSLFLHPLVTAIDIEFIVVRIQVFTEASMKMTAPCSLLVVDGRFIALIMKASVPVAACLRHKSAAAWLLGSRV
jgi:hypothetical protein